MAAKHSGAAVGDGALQCVEAAFNSPLYAETRALREAVLRVPLGLTLSAADLEGEAQQRHFALCEAGQLLACVVIKPETQGHAVKLRQMAVASTARGRGLGAELVQRVEALLRAEGVTTVTMSARQSAVGFYEKLGYRTVGEGYTDLGIPHIQMSRRL